MILSTCIYPYRKAAKGSVLINGIVKTLNFKFDEGLDRFSGRLIDK